MDVWRYSDWYGSGANEVRNSQRHIWQWRDWIIESLNQDKGYDRMILEMLAGDEIAPTDPATLRATVFWFATGFDSTATSSDARLLLEGRVAATHRYVRPMVGKHPDIYGPSGDSRMIHQQAAVLRRI